MALTANCWRLARVCTSSPEPAAKRLQAGAVLHRTGGGAAFVEDGHDGAVGLGLLDDGFGEGNFKALFESIEEDQIRRGVLKAGAGA